ncbi:MAG: hypothetical protein SGJ27_29800 [Candidatus Melainabacteria bacterium]|nr:hypothetical protein [Candidatus Melainabacteria bacterium]
MVNAQTDGFDSLVAAQVVDDQLSKNLFNEAYSSPRSSLADSRSQNQVNKLDELSLPKVSFGDSSDSPRSLSQTDREIMVSDLVHDAANPRSNAGEKPMEKKPLTKEEKAALAWELMLNMAEDGLKEQEVKENVDKATKAIKEGNFEELTKIIKQLSKADDDDGDVSSVVEI